MAIPSIPLRSLLRRDKQGKRNCGWDSVGRQQEAKYNFQFCDVIRIDRSEHEFQIVVEAQHRRLYHANSVFCLGVRTNKNTRRNLWSNGTSFSSWDGRRELVVCRVIEPGVIHPVNPFDPNLWNRVRNSLRIVGSVPML